jgi:hypothetical protein
LTIWCITDRLAGAATETPFICSMKVRTRQAGQARHAAAARSDPVRAMAVRAVGRQIAGFLRLRTRRRHDTKRGRNHTRALE